MCNYWDAQMYARGCHDAHQHKRKYSGAPYWVHPEEAADLIIYNAEAYSVEIISAAVCHDLVEDCGITWEQLNTQFGCTVADLVDEVSDKFSDHSFGNRATRKALELQRIATISPEAQTIKLADLISNTKDITKYDKEFAKVYLMEKKALMQVLTKGDKNLYRMATEQLEECLHAVYSA